MKMTVNVQLGMRIRYLREQKKLSQEDLALQASVSKNYLSDLECGRRNPTLKILKRVARGLGIDLAILFMGVGDRIN